MLAFVLSCEHGGNKVPAAFAHLFKGQQELLSSHRGYDIGAKELFEELKGDAHAAFFADTTRLLVELNRSLNSKSIFSSVTNNLPEPEKQQVLQEYYHPYRQAVEKQIQSCITAGRQVLHLSVHTFTPVLEGEVRQANIGLLYDPKRSIEKSFCRQLKEQLLQLQPSLQVRYNYPYLGVSDGFPTYLRRKFPAQQYIGIELEINQKYPLGETLLWEELKSIVKESLQRLLSLYKLPEIEK
ncbi:N-formylglutamate amidohydrolase [Pontibacter diazotrophicus]|uniref:N-formylglutamate amidohydrolase n=1 Tax=Pontibacter diazotrophicus TaxID=1400979 RepID=A0A3D8LBS9_9BACT|nr:N-formylglutamate amidohydrolase [Pontibacter diazotrophicus]RDV14754.1 N-formylglutamate amidohydrolase [Pontibacter diazotrophicus]